MVSSKAVIPIQSIDDPQEYERQYVHDVYDQIAGHFSSTRYKPWPLVAEFVRSLPTGWIGLDSGTGNGKYLSLPENSTSSIWTIGMDRSRNLLEHAKLAGGSRLSRDVILGDAITSPWRPNVFVELIQFCLEYTSNKKVHLQDYAISVATIHHFSSYSRRKQAIKSILRSISPKHGRALLYVWAVQQDELSKRMVPVNKLEEDSSEMGQDVFVPWISSQKQESSSEGQGTVAYNRYYHLFDQGELRALLLSAAAELGIALRSQSAASITPNAGQHFLEIIKDGWERSNWYVELQLSTA